MRLGGSLLLFLVVVTSSSLARTISMPATTRSQTNAAAADSASGSPLEQQAFGVFAGAPEHAAAPALLEVISMMEGGDDNLLELDALPGAHAPALTKEDREWLGRTLIACGFDMLPDGKLKASHETLDRLRKEQNAARRRAHAVAEESRKALLTAQLKELQRTEASPRTLAQARAALRTFLLAFDGQPAVGPVLLGCSALLRAQGTSGGGGQCWVVDRAALLNGGDAFVRQATPLFVALGVVPSGVSAEATEMGLAQADEIALEVAPGAWTASELAALAVVVERRCARMAFGARASGRIEGTARAFSPRECSSWWESLGTFLSAWLVRMAP